MKREQIIEYVNSLAECALRDHGMTLQAWERTRGHWEIRLNNVRQANIPTTAMLYVAHAMFYTASQFEPRETNEKCMNA